MICLKFIRAMVMFAPSIISTLTLSEPVTRNAHAVIPPRKNAKPWKPTSAGAIARNEAVSAQRYLGRTLWRRWSGYHRQSRVETKPLGIMLRITLKVSGCIA